MQSDLDSVSGDLDKPRGDRRRVFEVKSRRWIPDDVVPVIAKSHKKAVYKAFIDYVEPIAGDYEFEMEALVREYGESMWRLFKGRWQPVAVVYDLKRVKGDPPTETDDET